MKFVSEGDSSWVSTDGRFRVDDNPNTSYHEWTVSAAENASEKDRRLVKSFPIRRTKREALETLVEKLEQRS